MMLEFLLFRIEDTLRTRYTKTVNCFQHRTLFEKLKKSVSLTRAVAFTKYVAFKGNLGVLLGDSTYQLTHFMLVPFLQSNTEGEEEFNKAHRRMRSRVEQTFGILKSR